MTELPDGVDTEAMKWAIAWRIVETSISRSNSFIDQPIDKKRNDLKEQTREVYRYLSESMPATVVKNPLDM